LVILVLVVEAGISEADTSGNEGLDI